MYPMRLAIVTIFLILACCVSPAQSSDALFIDAEGDATFSGNATVKGTIRGIGMVPPGGIIMFAGNIGKAFDANGTGLPSTPYEGWQLCNGQNDSPDLRDRFIAAAGGKYIVGTQEGSDSVTLTLDQSPAHNHNGKTAASGSHQHQIEGTDANGLAWRARRIPGQTTVDMGFGGGRNADPGDKRWRGSVNTDSVRNHIHSFTTGLTGKGQPHENRPPFYALAFIMRLP